MKCPVCGYPESKVIDSRPIEEGNSIRRRRECLACQKRFTTFETIESTQIIVVKKNGQKELFDRQKLLEFRHKYVRACDGHAIERTIALLEN